MMSVDRLNPGQPAGAAVPVWNSAAPGRIQPGLMTQPDVT